MEQSAAAARRMVVVIQWADMACFREVLRGVNAFANTKASWRVHFFAPSDSYASFLERQKPDGAILGLMQPDQGRHAMAHVGHSVGVCGFQTVGLGGIPTIESDDERVGELGAQHFLRKGYQNFAFV